MVWRCLKNGWVLYSQKGVTGESKWRAVTRETEKLLFPWATITVLLLLFIDGGGWATMSQRKERVESTVLWCICNWMSFTQPFLLGLLFFRTAFPCSGGYHLERDGIPLMIVCLLSDSTWLPIVSEIRKSWYIIIIIIIIAGGYQMGNLWIF